MSSPKVPKLKSKIKNAKLLAKPDAKPKGIIRKPGSKPQPELEITLLDLQFENEELTEKNLKCRRDIAKLKAEVTQLKNDIIVLTEEFTEYKHAHPPFDPATASEKIKALEKEIQEIEKQHPA